MLFAFDNEQSIQKTSSEMHVAAQIFSGGGGFWVVKHLFLGYGGHSKRGVVVF